MRDVKLKLTRHIHMHFPLPVGVGGFATGKASLSKATNNEP